MVTKKLATNLRKEDKETPPARVAALPGFRGTLPLGMGRFIDGNTALTESEKELLSAANWTPGQPIPANLAQMVSDEQARLKVEAETTLPASPDTKPFKPPAPIKFEDLSPGKQKEIMDSIALANDQIRNMPNPIMGAGPGVNEALDLANSQKVKVVDSRKKAPPAEVEVKEEEVKEEVLTAGTDKLLNCPHCGWDLGVPEIATFEQEDKYVFKAALFGNTRFRKTYSLFAGQMQLLFRAITTRESDLVFRQLALDQKSGKVESMSDYMLNLTQYKLVCSLEKITLAETGPIELPEISEYELDKKDLDGQTELVKICEHVLKEALPMESIRRITVNQFAKFERVRELFEARAEDESFWQATEGSR